MKIIIIRNYDKHLNDPSRVVNKVGNFTIIQGEHNDRLGYTEYAFYNKNKGQAIIRIDSQTGGCNICLGKYNFHIKCMVSWILFSMKRNKRLNRK